ncbi:MAG: vWA domain-containing protein [Luteolibacter sp.]
MSNDDPQEYADPAPAGPPPNSFWRKLGGGSLSISIIVHAILLSIGVVWIFQVIPENKKEDVDFMPRGGGGGTPGVKNEINQRKRASMTAPNAPRMSAKGATSTFTLPEIDPASSMSSVGSLTSGGLSGGLGGSGSGGGRGDGHGQGMGSGTGMGVGLGGAAPAVLFFNQKVDAQRVAYVIDYSASMTGKREKLMRKELSASVKALSPLSKFQLIFFSGPAWVAGDTLVGENQSGKVEVQSPKGEKYKWEAAKSWTGEWKEVGRRQKPEWTDSNNEMKDLASQRIQGTKLSYGTCWAPSLEMALSMDPAPNVIFFMTDGVAENTEMRTIIAKAKVKGTVINTIAMMEPAAGEDMKKLAHGTGGKFTIVEENGQAKVEP